MQSFLGHFLVSEFFNSHRPLCHGIISESLLRAFWVLWGFFTSDHPYFGRTVIGVPEPLGPILGANIGPQGPSPNCTRLFVIPLNISASFDVNTHSSRWSCHCVAMDMMMTGAEATFPLAIDRPTPEFMWIFCLP